MIIKSVWSDGKTGIIKDQMTEYNGHLDLYRYDYIV
jgi:hypothetical protein